MGSCTRRHFLLSTCFLQLITIIERQVFDFLGYMWAPIFANFLHIIFVIFGFYGAYHFRVKYIITYLIWSIIWIGWNSFLICFYLNVGELDRDSDILNLGTGSVSWFEVNGYGCKPTYPTNITSDDPYRPIRPEHVDDCLLEYHLIEVVHSGVQCFLATLAIIGSIMISYIFLDEDDRLKHGSKKAKHRQSLYSIEFGPSSMDTIRNRADTILDYDDQIEDRNGQLSPKPMTPRRVKRRSVMTRGSNSRHSTTSRRSHASSSNRNSMRTSRRKYQQNPVTKLMDQQQQQMQQNTGGKSMGSFQHVENPALTASNLQSLNNEIVSSLTKPPKKYSSFNKNIPPDPIYYNTSSSTLQLQQSWASGNTSTGLYNPTYQHSTPNLNDGEHVDELYNNRPPSVRSSYSNFHGARPLSSYNPPVAENVFVGITGQQQHQQQHQQQQQQHLPHQEQQQLQFQQQQQQHQQQQHQHSHHHHHQQQQLQQNQQQQQQHSPSFSSTPPQNIPFSKRTASRESIRSMAFLNSGPPAYNLNYHTPPDSETTM
ncbi:sodium/potassium-transporting ATPase subunit beta-1-interacting protein isoform X3 [Eupeodes corollae]|uniref:sodium/potassium-transporting ATPase subunit beta-1-interacting protein isoform X3 n=1 Tax=Eupeodes corollae TaxID=290404 RepID=UPI0024939587|nr:sodium/potassium-transporting ATPase subunit beta-1-interacting protein isoform X3 [Eupeodes corollae]